MKLNYSLALLLTAGVLFVSSTTSRADDTNKVNESTGTTNAPQADAMSHDQVLHYDQTELYRANEMSVDIFGTASLGQYTIENPSSNRVRQNTEFGVGAGLNYYITRNLGVGVDGYSENTTGAFIDSASANLLLRFPLGESGFAPYAFGGGGHQFDMIQAWFGQAGAGLEYRFCPNMGMFLDARLTIPNETKYYGVARLGLRFAF